MADVYTTGSWRPFEGREAEFLEQWKEFMGWATSLPGAGTAVLARDLRDPGRLVSFAAWRDLEAMRAWKASPEFKPRMARVRSTSTSSHRRSSRSSRGSAWLRGSARYPPNQRARRSVSKARFSAAKAALGSAIDTTGAGSAYHSASTRAAISGPIST